MFFFEVECVEVVFTGEFDRYSSEGVDGVGKGKFVEKSINSNGLGEKVGVVIPEFGLVGVGKGGFESVGITWNGLGEVGRLSLAISLKRESKMFSFKRESKMALICVVELA
ncbi:hypothetical protein AB834_00585 [PVC group bacterium (ex Bugula neritina AB1)]|nr:hypothetical protein AB834_00585 [PVC group bacterium (ex Bugula neritina AB1)]